MTPKKRRPQPGGNGCGPIEFIAAASGDGSDRSLNIPVSQLLPRPVRPDELPELRALWWRHRAQGVPLPPEFGVIAIEGGRP
jgi:hypothetical protein